MIVSAVVYNLTLITLVAGGAVLALVFFFGAIVAGLTRANKAEQQSLRLNGRRGGSAILGTLLVCAVSFGILIAWKYQAARVEQERRFEAQMKLETMETEIATRKAKEAAALRDNETSEAATGLVISEAAETKPEASSTDTVRESLPGWTASPLTILSPGKVDAVLVVAKSELCATPEEAREEATVRAVASLQDRIGLDWPELDSWALPIDAFRQTSQHETHMKVELHEFAGREEPMYRFFIRFEDSAAVREKLLDRWKEDVGSVRAGQLAWGLGGLGIGLGLMSALLRGLLAVSSRRKKTVVATATILAAFSGLGILLSA